MAQSRGDEELNFVNCLFPLFIGKKMGTSKIDYRGQNFGKSMFVYILCWQTEHKRWLFNTFCQFPYIFKFTVK